ncbi:MAG: hypothetical protein PHR81_12645, partial [Bacteroidales bacterium]|nr:hypothetical protein [Bacteroidales bacterium]
PVYMMPEPMQAASVISPLRWGIDSFLDIFVRDAGLKDIGMNLLRMNAFFCISLLIALLIFVRRK